MSTVATPSPSKASSQGPILLSRLRLALTHLYAPPSTGVTNQAEAHSYLIEFQSRNARRKILSLEQRKKDSKKILKDSTQTQEQKERDEHEILQNAGSSLYALSSLLLPINNNYNENSDLRQRQQLQQHEAERLFCAQTLLHRVRRMKMHESIDWEIEFYNIQQWNATTLIVFLETVSTTTSLSHEDIMQFWSEFTKFHCEQLSSIYHEKMPLVGKVLEQYYVQRWMNINSRESGTSSDYDRWGYGAEIEEKIKGEVTLIILATVAYFNMYSHLIRPDASSHNTHIGPLMNTLTSAMAVVAMRLRYTSSSVSSSALPGIHKILQESQEQQDSTSHYAATTTPIVTMILQAFETVFQVASSLSMQEILMTSQNDVNQQHEAFHNMLCTQTLHQCICISLSCIPDALLGSPGGVRGRLSVDPKCVQATNTELRFPETGVGLVKEALARILEHQDNEHNFGNKVISKQRHFFITCERWAIFVPLPIDFVEQTVSFSLSHVIPNIDLSSSNPYNTSIKSAFCSYLISIFESACMSIDNILASSVGILSEQNNSNHPSGRKRQSSRAKKRHKEKVQSMINGTSYKKNNVKNSENTNIDTDSTQIKRALAERELDHRGMVACRAAMLSWDVLYELVVHSLNEMAITSDGIAQGEGPVGCICTMTSACLPYIIKIQLTLQQRGGEGELDTTSAFVGKLIESFRVICSNDNATVRALTFEHFSSILSPLVEKTATVKVTTELTNLETSIAKNLCDCALALAEKCAYPAGYFTDLSLDNDEDLEVERNDVRDIIRVLTNLDKKMQQVPLLINDYILQYCCEKIITLRTGLNTLPPEAAVHILSSPAKTLLCLAESISNPIHNSEMVLVIIQRALDCIKATCESVIESFRCGSSITETLPVSRLLCICLASYSPFFSSLLSNSDHLNNELLERLQQVLGLFIFAAAESITHIPELVSSSSLNLTTLYDIRGAMRGPGGEDHVGCIAIMRLAFESEHLALAALKFAAAVNNVDVVFIIMKLSQLHESLHALEMKRAPGVSHGTGVAPKSRRVLLKSICRFGCIIAKHDMASKDLIQTELRRLFSNPLSTMLKANTMSDISRAQLLYYICESTYDLSSFPPEFCSLLFESEIHSQQNDVITSMQLLVNIAVSGYNEFINCCDSTETVTQWGRIRGSLFALLRSCANPGLTELAVRTIVALNNAECESIENHCRVTKPLTSSIFHPLVVGDESIPAGIFLISIRDILDSVLVKYDSKECDEEQLHSAVLSCTAALSQCNQTVFSALKTCCPDSTVKWQDPRQTLAEAWFAALNGLLVVFKRISATDCKPKQELVYQSMALCINFIISAKVQREPSRESRNDGFMCLDGPQSLGLVEFIELALMDDMSASLFDMLGNLYQNQMKLDYDSIGQSSCSSSSFIGGAIVSAVLFRGVSGGLPPWTVEYTPNIYKSLFRVCGGVDQFCAILLAGSDLKLQSTPDSSFGAVSSGKKLAGCFFDHLKPKSKEEFLQKIREICVKKSDVQWRNVKVIIKAICGGKKKAASFNLKPQPTNWECNGM